MRLSLGGIFNDSFIATYPQSVPVKEFQTSVENWLSYRYELVYHFLEHSVMRN